MLKQLTSQLAKGLALSDVQVAAAVEQLIAAGVSVEAKAGFLTALGQKGETPAEIFAFVRELRARATPLAVDEQTRARVILDVCGTGGDRLNTFNISTTVALVAAAAGVTVAKHGNRAVTSQAGSADVLEALGVPVDLPPEQAARALREQGFAFFFAPAYHPAFKQVGAARKLCSDRGQRTIFNYLGPLLNPARPSAQLIGVPRPQLCEPLAQVLQQLGARRGMVVSGQARLAHLDELSPLGKNFIAEFDGGSSVVKSEKSPDDFPLQPATLADLEGGTARTNAQIVRRIFSGAERGPKRDAVLLNASAALFVAGQARLLREGWELAAEVIDSGKAQAKLEELRTR